MILKIALFSGFAGITVFIGGLLANFFKHHTKKTPVAQQFVHSLMCFGAGIILSAVALVLVPKGMETLEVLPLCVAFALGALLFMGIDRYLSQKGGKMATLLAMLMDFIPESIALGAIFASDQSTAILLAIFIGLQNLPESFNAYRDLVVSGFKVKTTLIIFFFLSFFGLIGAFLGYQFLQDVPEITALLMVFAGGGILYLLVQDIIPESHMEGNSFPAIWATLGFMVGIIGEMLI